AIKPHLISALLHIERPKGESIAAVAKNGANVGAGAVKGERGEAVILCRQTAPHESERGPSWTLGTRTPGRSLRTGGTGWALGTSGASRSYRTGRSRRTLETSRSYRTGRSGWTLGTSSPGRPSRAWHPLESGDIPDEQDLITLALSICSDDVDCTAAV